jgi:multiple sugar transport system substrate-binding protein
MSTSYTRRQTLAVIAGATAMLPQRASAAGFDWKRYSGTQLRFMVSTHPWTDWAQKQLPGLEEATGIKVSWEILYEDQFRQKLPLTLRSDPGAVDGFFTLPSWDAAALHAPSGITRLINSFTLSSLPRIGTFQTSLQTS